MFKSRLGHVHLFVRELERSVSFYTKFVNLRVTETVNQETAFLSTCDLHHELALTELGSDAIQPQPDSIGLFHLAFDVPDKKSFAEAYQKLVNANVEISPVDHKIGWGMYFEDPDGNLLEIYCDTRNEPDGEPAWGGKNRPLSSERILAEFNMST